MKVVLDTNVFISGVFWKGDSNRIILAWKEGKIKLVVSLEAISELARVLRDSKIKMPHELIKEWIDLIIKNSELVKIQNKIKIIKEDPTDDIFLETALIGRAKYIITQDAHLLKLKEFRGIRIITPGDFLKK